LVNGGIVFYLYSPGGSIDLTVWLQFAITCFRWGGWPSNVPFPWVCHWSWDVYMAHGSYVRRVATSGGWQTMLWRNG